MTPDDLKAWRTHMGLSQRAAATALGVNLTTYQRKERGAYFDSGVPVEIDRTTALACAALALGLDEWHPPPGPVPGFSFSENLKLSHATP